MFAAPLCDLCRKLYACDDVDADLLPRRLRQFWDKAANDDEVICSGCLELLRRLAKKRRLPSKKILSLREYKLVACSECRSDLSKRGQLSYNHFCFKCNGMGETLVERTPLEQLSDAADDL